MFTGQAFSDEDGDGRQGLHEKGLPGVGISLSGPAQSSATTGNDGRFSLPDLPDGEYTLTITPPAGIAALPSQVITLSDGAVLSLPLRPLAQLSGTIYAGWDGDGQRGGDELPELTPISVKVNGLGDARTVLGSFTFWDVAPGSYTLDVTVPPGLEVNLPTITVTEGQGKAAGLAVVIAPATEGYFIHLPFISR